MAELTHFDESGASRMVDVGDKEITQRVAVAEAVVTMQPATLELIRGGGMDKGDVYEVARLAGIGATEARIANLEKSLEYGSRQKLILEQLGPLQVEASRFEDAETTYQALLDLDGKNASAYNELAFLAYRRGDLNRALALISAAVEIEPTNPKYRENLGRVEQAIRQSTGRTGG